MEVDTDRRPRGRWVIYVDMDAFYVSCEVRDRPELAGAPVIVGPDPKLGPTPAVVLSASYEPRESGVRSALPVQQADRLCPAATWVPPDFPKYERVSEEVLGRLSRFDAEVRPHSIDEAALTVEVEGPLEAERVAREIQEDLARTLRLPASIGVAPNRLVAKIASDQAKPGGIRVVPPETVAAFLEPLPARAVPGIGPKTAERLRALGIERIGQLARASRRDLVPVLGSATDEYQRLARGEYVDPPEAAEGPRSRSAEETFSTDLSSLPALEDAVARLARRLGEALEEERLRYQTVTVALRWSDFIRVQRSRTLSSAREGPAEIEGTARRLVRELWTAEKAGRRRAVRMVSVGAERLVAAHLRSVPLDRFGDDRGTVK